MFDLDGVVVDTREAVRAAYRAAGVEMPDDAWGRPWREWCDAATHDRKNAAYVDALIRFGRPGPMFDVVKHLDTEALVLTGASDAAARRVARLFNLGFNLLGVERSRGEKIDDLRQFARDREAQVIYFDDDAGTVKLLHGVPNVTAVLIK